MFGNGITKNHLVGAAVGVGIAAVAFYLYKKNQAKVDELTGELQFSHSKEHLKQYIINHKDALDNLTSLMEISTERFKRMVSMIRKDRGFVFSTEWGLGKIRKAMIDSPEIMESVLDLLY